MAPLKTSLEVSTEAKEETAKWFSTMARWVAIAGWASIIIAIILGVKTGVLTSVESVQNFLEQFGWWAPAVYVALGASEAVFPVVPGSATLLAAPIIFGPMVGFITAYLATCIGSAAVFLLSRHLGATPLYSRFKEETVEKYLGWLHHKSFVKWFTIAIALPLAPDDLLCYLAGLTKMSFRRFIFIIILLKPWSLALYTLGIYTILQRVFPGLGL